MLGKFLECSSLSNEQIDSWTGSLTDWWISWLPMNIPVREKRKVFSKRKVNDAKGEWGPIMKQGCEYVSVYVEIVIIICIMTKIPIFT